ncbi:hypothetical protein DMA10_15035 [Streptomyces sp. WAC 01420]|nr:hypothetical protein DLM49_31685 [Streptomyces sp. WAC 01438]RSM96004.1 hypothetical protein DMA10_15035 [Streptomyces sp. WAC 01420]
MRPWRRGRDGIGPRHEPRLHRQAGAAGRRGHHRLDVRRRGEGRGTLPERRRPGPGRPGRRRPRRGRPVGPRAGRHSRRPYSAPVMASASTSGVPS